MAHVHENDVLGSDRLGPRRNFGSGLSHMSHVVDVFGTTARAFFESVCFDLINFLCFTLVGSLMARLPSGFSSRRLLAIIPYGLFFLARHAVF